VAALTPEKLGRPAASVWTIGAIVGVADGAAVVVGIAAADVAEGGASVGGAKAATTVGLGVAGEARADGPAEADVAVAAGVDETAVRATSGEGPQAATRTASLLRARKCRRRI